MSVSSDSPSGATGTARLHALDAVRGFALAAGVFLHGAMAFLPGPQLWTSVDPERSTALSVLFFVIHVFRMTTFFLIAGFFGRMLLERRGTGGFLRDRGMRIALPLIVFWPLIYAAVTAVFMWAIARSYGAALSDLPMPPLPDLSLEQFPLLHLWFLWLLLIFYVVALALRALVGAVTPNDAVMRRIDGVMRVLAGPLAPVLMAVPLFALFATAEGWFGWLGIPTPDQALIPGYVPLAAYGLAFGFGWLVQRQPELLLAWSQRWLPALGLAAAAIAGCLFLGGLTPRLVPTASDAEGLAYAACYAIAVWSATLAVIAAALRFASGQSEWRRMLADASYWIYLLHLPVVMALHMLVQPLTWPAEVKFLVVVVATFALTITSYLLLVRRSFIGRWLNGRRAATAA